MGDYLVRVIAKNGKIRGLACVTTELVSEGCKRHGTLPTATAALGRALTAGTLMGALLKTGQRVALRYEGNGPLKKIIVEADSNGSVRGYVAEPLVQLMRPDGRLNVASGLGRAGFLTVTKDLMLKEPYRGSVMLYSGEIAQDLALYLVESEQIPSAVALSEFIDSDGNVAVSGGFLIQALPPVDTEVVDQLMNRIGEMPPLSDLLRQGKSPEEILELLFQDLPHDTLEKRALAFACSCSRERIERVLISTGHDEILSLIEEQGGAEVTCEFCRQQYSFSHEDLDALLKELEAGAQGQGDDAR
ncbi:Hsp33 family molecular chaperone HslO [Geomonas sp. RF6]|uniref:Hsp33 family molecular chaperone HslO n=1 Tax=Geomonas sp. RF6 TaxID=2897342 RepID=UPI001E376880|nr:Hsp33 family molecular chaperone HslO [Geomonas sp. RF6]UFS71785.1 Hsp33 family molecular chaperone HslO [Geomonas sp. RF6]